MDWVGVATMAVLTNLVLFGPATVALLVAHFYDDIAERLDLAPWSIRSRVLDAAVCKLLSLVGSEPAAPSSSERDDECVVCLNDRSRPARYLYACAHRCVCDRCDRRALRAMSTACDVCPLCRAPKRHPWFQKNSQLFYAADGT